MAKGLELNVLDVAAGSVPKADVDLVGRRVEMLGGLGQTGCCFGWNSQNQKYAVQFDGGVVSYVPHEQLQQRIPETCEEVDEIDWAWPVNQDGKYYAANVITKCLETKGYCILQMPLSKREVEEVAEDALLGRSFKRMCQEVEHAYFGYENSTKYATIIQEDSPAGLPTPVDKCTSQFREVAKILGSAPSNIFDFQVAGLSHCMVRSSMEDDYEREEVAPENVEDGGEDAVQELAAYIEFGPRRRVSMLYMIDNEGGDMWLYLREGEQESVRLSVSRGKLVIFRHDMYDYSYQPVGASVALQQWILDRPVHPGVRISEIELRYSERCMVANPGTKPADGPTANVLSLATRLPGNVWSPDEYWVMFTACTDGCPQWPVARWDTDPYYELDTDSVRTGKSYTCHGGFVTEEQITQLDNEFFGISFLEAKSMLPGQKLTTEVGYEALYGAGFRKDTLRGERIGTWFGDVGPDWHSFQDQWGGLHPDVPLEMFASSMTCAGTASRLSYLFDFAGPISSYDTACSASLVATNAAFLTMFNQDPPRPENSQALICGVNTLLGPGSFIGNCMATMLSHQGRSFTFNRSADGYQRGEGAGSIFLKLSTGDPKEEELKVASLVGTATNQDGRSASLTAPNGPAQQQVIKKSMRFAGINPNTVSIAECHGTGTALGDPIEVGALMAVMHARQFPICKTSAKSNIAHLEAGAGIAGLTKCIMMINSGCAPPNVHFNIINPHLTIQGYPVIFESELIQTGMSSLNCGVSSFGFGGTNSRADVYGIVKKGMRRAIKVMLPPTSLPWKTPDGERAYIRGSWSAWSAFEEMDEIEENVWVASIVLGETRYEEFQISATDDNMKELIHPVVRKGGPGSQAVGPDEEGQGKVFVIDGRADGVPAGTVYEVRFEWTPERKIVTWEVEQDRRAYALLGEDYTHKYYLSSSTRKYALEEMTVKADGSFTAQIVIGHTMSETFQVVRDKNWEQVIYPGSTMRTSPAGKVVLGPNNRHSRRYFRIFGDHHEIATVTLSFEDSEPVITTFCRSAGKHTWGNFQTWALDDRRSFHLTGSVNGHGMTPMIPQEGTPGLHTCEVTVPVDFARFRIGVGGNSACTMGPDARGAFIGPTHDPQENLDKEWVLRGAAGTTFEVTLDLRDGVTSKAVTWRQTGGPAAGLPALEG